MDETGIREAIAAARELGLEGFGGSCGEAAVAINRVLFDGRGTLVGAFNEAFLDHGRLLGHVAVLVDGTYWDADGRPKPLDEVESWGMLDPHDPDHAACAAEAGIAWDDDTASQVAVVEFDGEDEVLERFGASHLGRFLDALEGAVAAAPADAPAR